MSSWSTFHLSHSPANHKKTMCYKSFNARLPSLLPSDAPLLPITCSQLHEGVWICTKTINPASPKKSFTKLFEHFPLRKASACPNQHRQRSSSMNRVVSRNDSGGALQPVFEHRQLLQLSRRKEEEAYFVDYIPPARDAITLPRNVVYVLVGVVLVIVATYAIVGHLIKDLMHDLAGNLWQKPPESMSSPPVTLHSGVRVCFVSEHFLFSPELFPLLQVSFTFILWLVCRAPTIFLLYY